MNYDTNINEFISIVQLCFVYVIIIYSIYLYGIFIKYLLLSIYIHIIIYLFIFLFVFYLFNWPQQFAQCCQSDKCCKACGEKYRKADTSGRVGWGGEYTTKSCGQTESQVWSADKSVAHDLPLVRTAAFYLCCQLPMSMSISLLLLLLLPSMLLLSMLLLLMLLLPAVQDLICALFDLVGREATSKNSATRWSQVAGGGRGGGRGGKGSE